jgi:transposase
VNERTSIDLVPNLVRGHRRNGCTVYDIQARRELARRCMQPGVSVAGTALAHGINANLLRRWIMLETGPRRERGRQAKLVEVAAPQSAVTALAAPEWAVELVVAGMSVRVRNGVSLETLRTVLACLASRA